jgi:plastocyanin
MLEKENRVSKRLSCLYCLGWLILVLPAGLSQAGNTQIVLLDRMPFYAPSTVTILPGQSVRWDNRSMQPHTVTHDGCGRGRNCAFASKHLHPGEHFSVRGLPPGTYSYHCEIHPFMRGRLHVKRMTQDHSVTEL